MVSLIPAPNHVTVSPVFVRNSNFPAVSTVGFVIGRGRSGARLRRGGRDNRCLAFWDLKWGGQYETSSWCCGCKGREGEGDLALEAEILEFMAKSKKPSVFPTKKDLVDGGRMDLVEAIAKSSGWLSLGWDLDESHKQDDNTLATTDCNNAISSSVDDVGDVQKRFEKFGENASDKAEEGSATTPVSNDSSQSTSSSGRSLETVAKEDTGIEGILSRLEQERNLSFGINFGINGYSTAHANKEGGDDPWLDTSTDEDSADLERSRKLSSASSNKDSFSNSANHGHNRTVSDFDGIGNSSEPKTWRTWSFQRARSLNTKFEAAEISFEEDQMNRKKDDPRVGIRGVREAATDTLDRRKEINHSEMWTRLQHLDLEVASALHSLRSHPGESHSNEGHDGLSDDLHKLSDDREFQENEFMKAQDRLRSLRAKLAVLEGKMALAIIDAQKMAEEKQKRIDGARKALQLLRTACIVWPNTASEVLLAGSFDGWTSQRKMEKSSTGVFSICLQLYRGRYEIKFIVDGKWRTDPLRPVVHNNGHENNLLIIS